MRPTSICHFSHQVAMMRAVITIASRHPAWQAFCPLPVCAPGPNITFTHLPTHNRFNSDLTLAEDFLDSTVVHLRCLSEDFVANVPPAALVQIAQKSRNSSPFFCQLHSQIVQISIDVFFIYLNIFVITYCLFLSKLNFCIYVRLFILALVWAQENNWWTRERKKEVYWLAAARKR